MVLSTPQVAMTDASFGDHWMSSTESVWPTRGCGQTSHPVKKERGMYGNVLCQKDSETDKPTSCISRLPQMNVPLTVPGGHDPGRGRAPCQRKPFHGVTLEGVKWWGLVLVKLWLLVDIPSLVALVDWSSRTARFLQFLKASVQAPNWDVAQLWPWRYHRGTT